MIKNKLALYIHIPFCQKKCSYCDFFSAYAQTDIIDSYCKQVAEEIKLLSRRYPAYFVQTVYLGGGTPSVLSLENLHTITQSIYTNFECNIVEFTIEVNPTSAQNLPHYKKFGIDRISLGVQSFDDAILQKINRLHDSKMALSALDKAANLYGNVSCDLMLGINPNQDIVNDAKRAARFAKHLSCYMLKVEDNTPLNAQILSNNVAVATDDEQVLQYEQLYEFCQSKAMDRYETSNFAYSGYESKHNFSYWDMSPYLGVGASAHSFIEGKRFYNAPNLHGYLDGNHAGNFLEVLEREYNYQDTVDEHIMLALRTKKGIKISDFNKKYGKDFLQDYANKLQKAAHYLVIKDDYVSIMPQFILLQNSVIAMLL